LLSIILKLIGRHFEALLPTTEDYKYTYGLKLGAQNVSY